jgi:nucleoid DNA-binding protein
MALTKKEIIEAVAKENDFLKNRSAEIVESLIEIIKRSLESGEDVLVSGLEVRVRQREEWDGIQTGGIDVGTEKSGDFSLFGEVKEENQ